MILTDRSLHDLSFSYFLNLINSRVPECPNLIYKETSILADRPGFQELLGDIASIANQGFGYILIGVKKDEINQPVELNSFVDFEEICLTIKQACLDYIQERIDGLELKGYELEPGRGFIVIHIPKSAKTPHMVSFAHHSDFFQRYATGKRIMSIDEIRSLMMTNPFVSRMIEQGLIASGKLIKPGQSLKKTGPPYVRIFTDGAVDQFLQKYMLCKVYPQTLVIVSPFISDLAGELTDLSDIVNKINRDKTTTYIITRPSNEDYQKNSINILSQSPYIEIRYNEDVHAKLYICWCRKDEHESFALFGSGNLTSGGLRHNIELGMMIYSKEHGRALIGELFKWSANDLRSKSKRIKKIQKYLLTKGE
jgi:hypothetical protein